MESLTDQVGVPRDLLDALQNDRLVVFAGAGASMGAPTNLPNFKELARQLAVGVGYPHVLKNGEPIDAYLGQIEGYCGTDLDRLTEDLLSVRRRSPNSLHMAIASLASVSTLRLVTTNYDQCFQSALKSLDLQFTEYVAPVLPLGDAFTGIVHLHGQAPLGPGQELVLTDSDFGRAYVNRGWATRFLTEMFENFTVLFVGYSGDDTIMRYLTRGLPPASKHYAFTAPEGEASWRALGIVPLVYPPGVDHGALPEAIVAMVDQASDDPIEHFRRVIQIVDSGFPLNAVDETYIRRICAKAETLRLFVEAAQPDKWIDWLTDRSMIDGVWEQPMRPDSEESEVWARWICELLTSDPSGLLRLIHKHGGTLSNALWQAVWLALWNNYPEPVAASHYLTLLMDHPASGRYLGHMSKLFSKVSTKDRAGALRLLGWLLRPNPKFVPDLVALLSDGDGELVLDFEVSADTYDLRSGWSELQPLSRAERSSLLVQCIAYVEQVSFALRNSQPRNRRDDRASLSRTKINYDEVDSHKIGIGILVDICRDVLRASCAEGSRSAHSVLEILLDSESTLCRRLALDAISETEILSSDSALEILVMKGWLYDNRLKPEMVRVLVAKYPHASPSSKSEIVNAVMGSGASGRKQHLEDYTRHSLLLQLTGSDPSDDFAAAGLTKIRLRNPGFPAEKPKSPAWNPFTGIQVYGYEPSGLLKGASTDTIVNEASNLDENEPNEEWLSEIRLVVGESQSLAYSLMSAFVRRKVWNLRLWEELLDGLADHGVSDASPVLQSLRSHPHKESLVPTLVSFLQSSWQRSGAKVIPASVIESELRSVFALWRDVTGQSPWIPELETEDSTFRSMQDPRGGLVFLYLFRLRSLVSHGYRQLDEVVTSELRAFLDDGAQSLDATLVQVGAFAAFLSHVEHGWTRANVLPLLDWNRYPNQAVLVWSGFLSQDSWTKEMEPYLSRVVRVAAPWVRKNLASYFDLFLRHHARLFSFGSSRLIPVKWADPLIVNLSPLERAKWIDLISACGRSEPGVDARTRRRMAGFWRRRAKGLPVPMSGVESAAMSAWLLISRDSFAEFCPLFLLSPVPDGSQATPRALIEMQSLPFEHEPSKSARVLIHLLKGERLFKSERHTNWLMEPARKLAKPLLSSPHEQEARGILRELIRLGDRESLQLVIGTV